MKVLVFLSLFFLIGIMTTQAADFVSRTFTVEGKKISCKVRNYAPPLGFKLDAAMLNQTSAANCSALFYSHLTKGEIDKAAALSNDPDKVKTKFVRQRDRIGEAEFKKMFADYFSGTVTLRHELAIGSSHMLIVYDSASDFLAAQFYAQKDGRFVVDEQNSPDRDQLGRIFQQIREGTLKVE